MQQFHEMYRPKPHAEMDGRARAQTKAGQRKDNRRLMLEHIEAGVMLAGGVL